LGKLLIHCVLFFSASRREADRLFKGVLNCRDKANATRNALSAMQRNKFLFSLPTNIERNSMKGDYDLTCDYARAKTLFGDSEIEVFILLRHIFWQYFFIFLLQIF
jgi:hypothetical protein